MITEHPMGRVANGLNSHGTVNSSTLSIAFMEFLLDRDSNQMKSLWRSHGWHDISPIWGDRPTVVTFKDNPAVIAQWPEFQEAMTEVEADWYYLSGHHGRQFDSDLNYYAPHGMDFANYTTRGGFFNEPYHQGRWKHARVEEPQKGARDDEVYMTTTDDLWAGKPGPADNPLYNAPHENCRGLFLVGCNSLAYRTVRTLLSQYFPKAVIIGLATRETNAIMSIMNAIRPLGRDFFINPKATISPEKLTARLTPFPANPDNVAVMSDGQFYFRTQTRIAAVPHDKILDRDDTR